MAFIISIVFLKTLIVNAAYDYSPLVSMVEYA